MLTLTTIDAPTDSSSLMAVGSRAVSAVHTSAAAARIRAALSTLTSRVSRGVQCERRVAPPAESDVNENRLLERLRTVECCFCLTAIRECMHVIVSRCRHFFCRPCVDNWVQTLVNDQQRPYGDWVRTRLECPMCRTRLDGHDSMRTLGKPRKGLVNTIATRELPVESVNHELSPTLDELALELERLAVGHKTTRRDAKTQCNLLPRESWFSTVSSSRSRCPGCDRAFRDCVGIAVPECGKVVCSDCSPTLGNCGSDTCAVCPVSVAPAWMFS